MPIRQFNDVTGRLWAHDAAQGLCLDENELDPEFFNLRSGLAGEFFQKFVNYQLRLALVLRDPSKYGGRFSELALEHRTHPLVRFFTSREGAEQWLDTRESPS